MEVLIKTWVTRRRRSMRFLVMAWMLLPVAHGLQGQQVTTGIKLNQLGFYPNAPKLAVITEPVSSLTFYITSTNLRDTVFTGKLGEERQSAYSSARTRIADFSSLTRRGSFVVLISDTLHSYVFRIADDAHQEAARATLKGYYYQRASMPLEERYAGKWHRSAGHPDTAVYIHSSAADSRRGAGTVIASPGGWYDAGDYNKYVVNSGITMGTLLSAFEDFSAYFGRLHTNIPESGDAIPDILNEVLYNLRWMLTMQDKSDGGVYHKCTNASFDGMLMPGITRAPRYVVQKGTAATLDFAAVTAQATRIFNKFKKQLPGLADSCLQASVKAWQWALLHPSVEYDQGGINKEHKPAIVTGAYGDKLFKDEWFWAASEMYVTTADRDYYAVVQKYLADTLSLPSWSNVALPGYYSLLRFSKMIKPSDIASMAPVKEMLIAMANRYIEKCLSNAFQTVMGQSGRDFNWGGNSNAANQGILLINAYLLTMDKKYIDFALANLDYLLGRNATGYCFVTGLGSKPPMFPHHRPSTADGITEPVPGLLVGGPKPGHAG